MFLLKWNATNTYSSLLHPGFSTLMQAHLPLAACPWTSPSLDTWRRLPMGDCCATTFPEWENWWTWENCTKNSPSAWKHLCFSAFSLAFMLQTSLLSLLSLMSTFQCCLSWNIFCTIYPIGVKSFSELSSIPVCHYAVGAICITSIDLHRIAATLSWRSNTTLAATQR